MPTLIRKPVRSAGAILTAVLLVITGILTGPQAHADQSDLIDEAASALGVGSGYRVSRIGSGGDVTSALRTAVKVPGSAAHPLLVVLPATSISLTAPVYPANHVYVVADPATTVTWAGSGAQMVRFAGVTGGVYGGVWDGAQRGATHVFNVTASPVRFARLTVKNAGGNGFAVYSGATVRLSDVDALSNGRDGINVSASTLTATRVRATSNKRNGLYLKSLRADVSHSTFSFNKENGIATYPGSDVTLREVTSTRNRRDGLYAKGGSITADRFTVTLNTRSGVQLADKAVVAITNSALDRNGQGVKGSTTDKIGHGLGVGSKASATVSRSTISGNKVCGISLTSGGSVTVKDSTIASNGRHGVGTRNAVTGSFTKTKISKNGYNGVLATASGTKITLVDSSVTSSKKFGISVPSKGSVSLKRTTVSRSGSSNISVTGGGKLTLKQSNTITSAKSDGIAVSGKSRVKVTGVGNQITSNKANGLRVSGAGTEGRIENALTVKGNKKAGILVHVKARLQTVKNKVSGGKAKGTVTKSGGKVVKL